MRTRLLLACIVLLSPAASGGQIERRTIYTPEYDAALIVEPDPSTPEKPVRFLYLRRNQEIMLRVEEEPSSSPDGTLIVFQDARSKKVLVVHTKLNVTKELVSEYHGLVLYYHWFAKRGHVRLEFEGRQFLDVKLPEFDS